MSKSNRFNFFVPFEINKAKGNDQGKIWINGICSSNVEDSDEETLDPAGFDFQPLLKSGFFNYNHQGNKTSKAIVGEPTFAEVRNNGSDLYVEGFLYGDSEEAQNIVKLADILEKNNSSRRLGYSIEGQALERDPLNPKKINKARITGIAITASPKNPNTLLSIMKGEYAEPFIDIDDNEFEEVSKAEGIDIEKGGPGSGRHKTNDIIDSQFNHSLSKNSKGDYTYTVKHKNDKDVRAKFTAKAGEDKEDFLNRITDEVKMFKKQASNIEKSEDDSLEKGGPGSGRKRIKSPFASHSSINGKELTPKKSYEVDFASGKKKYHTFEHEGREYDVDDEHTEDVEKAMTADAGEGVTQVESVDGGQKILNGLLKEKKMLKKSEVYSEIINKYPNANTDQISQVFKLIEKINNDIMKSEENAILDEALNKSFEMIDSNIEKANSATDKDLDIDKDGDDKDAEKKINEASDDGDKEKAVDKDDDADDEDSKAIEKSELDTEGGIVSNVENNTQDSFDLELDFFKAMAETRIAKGMTQEEAVIDLQKKGLSLEMAQKTVQAIIDDASQGKEQGLHYEGQDLKQEVPQIKSGVDLTVTSDPTISKAEKNEFGNVINVFEKSISDSFTNINEKFTTIEKSFADQLNNVSSQLSEFIDIHKSTVDAKEALHTEIEALKEEKENLEKSLASISERLENIEQTPQQSKSITKSVAVERFSNSQENGKKTYSISANKSQVLNFLDSQYDQSVSNGVRDENLVKSIMNIEISGIATDDDIRYLNNRFSSSNIEFTR